MCGLDGAQSVELVAPRALFRCSKCGVCAGCQAHRGRDLCVHHGHHRAGRASKRGWTTWSVGGATCTGDHCVNIVALAPLVPIAPNIHDVIHRQWQSYGGFTFAFKDYTDLQLTQYVDDPRFAAAMEISDPKYQGERLSRLPKFVVVSSDDEFMSMDWTNIW